MKVIVAGATGVAGGGVVPALVAAGYDVTAVIRSPAKAQMVLSWGATPVEVDLFDRAAVLGVVAGHAAVCNLTTHIPSLAKAGLPGAWKENDRIRRVVSANLIEAALAGDASYFLQESVGFVYPDQGDRWIDEKTPPRPSPVTQSVLEAEANVERFAGSGRSGVVLRFAQFYGPGATHSVEMVRMAARFGIAPTIGDPNGFMSSIHRDDVGPAVVAALGAPTGTYNVGDDEPLRRRELHAVFAQALGRSRLHEVGKLMARLGGRKAEATARSQRLSSDGFRTCTGWSPTVPTARLGWPAVIAREVGSGS